MTRIKVLGLMAGGIAAAAVVAPILDNWHIPVPEPTTAQDILLIALGICFVPTIVAVSRKHRNALVA
jgi:hypothetical protein